MSTCGCYASELDAQTRFSTRYGAHELTCPAYKPSMDPVDAAEDEAFRAYYAKLRAAQAETDQTKEDEVE